MNNGYCPNCGSQTAGNSNFCTKCGMPFAFTQSAGVNYPNQGHYNSVVSGQIDIEQYSNLALACAICSFIWIPIIGEILGIVFAKKVFAIEPDYDKAQLAYKISRIGLIIHGALYAFAFLFVCAHI